ncbi:hypothetical protein HN51_058901 [Arachis hypogaea]
MKGACWFFHHPIHNKSNETWRKRSEHFAAEEFLRLERETSTKMFQFAKFSKSKERRLAAKLGYGFPIGDPWITDGYTSDTLNTNPISKKVKATTSPSDPDVSGRFVIRVF